MLPRAVTIFAASVGTGLALTGCGGGGAPASTRIGKGPAHFILDVAARPASAHVWSDTVRVPPGGLIQHTIRLANIGGDQAVGVRVHDRLGPGERSVFASTHVQSLGVTMAIASATAPGLFGPGASIAPLPGGGTTRIIQFQTRAGRRSFVEPVTLRWDGGQLSRNVRVTVSRSARAGA